MSGGQAGAENGELTVMCGGTAQYAGPRRSLSYARACRLRRHGARGSYKNVQPDLIAGLVQGLAEALAFAQRAGLNMKDVIEVSKGAAHHGR